MVVDHPEEVKEVKEEVVRESEIDTDLYSSMRSRDYAPPVK